jgi:hypothetical protein
VNLPVLRDPPIPYLWFVSLTHNLKAKQRIRVANLLDCKDIPEFIRKVAWKIFAHVSFIL